MVEKLFLYFQVVFWGGRGGSCGRYLMAAFKFSVFVLVGKNEIDQSENEYILALHISYPISAVNTVNNSAEQF